LLSQSKKVVNNKVHIKGKRKIEKGCRGGSPPTSERSAPERQCGGEKVFVKNKTKKSTKNRKKTKKKAKRA
jgi:hypothetical protein